MGSESGALSRRADCSSILRLSGTRPNRNRVIHNIGQNGLKVKAQEVSMPGLEDWWEAFPSGKHTDSAGRTKEWSEKDIDRIIEATTSKCLDDVPFVIGHPKDTAPAYGWIAGLKKENGRLYVKGRDVMPEFNELVKTRRFPKRSISLRPDFSIRHIGFLGAVPPAIKGIQDVQFSDSEGDITIEFAEVNSWTLRSIAGVFRRLREFFIEKDGVDAADRLLPEYAITDLEQAATAPEAENQYAEHHTKEDTSMAGPTTQSPPTQFSEADVERIRIEALEQGKREGAAAAAVEFAEQQKQERAQTTKDGIAVFLDDLKAKGQLLPAWERLGLRQFMESLDSETVIEFSEGETGRKSKLDFFKSFLSELPKVIKFGETAGRGKETAATGDGKAGEKLDAIVEAKMKANKDLCHAAAFAEAQVENPDLALEYQAELGGK